MRKDKTKKAKKQGRLYAFLYAILAKLIRGIFRVRVIGAENEPTEGSFLLISNHTSALDPVIIAASMNRQICFMGKKELFKIPLLGGLLRMLGSFPIDRKGTDIGAIKTMVNILKDGRCTGIFPQGTRCPYVDPRETEVKTGVSLVAARSGADILPVCVKTKKNKARFFRRTYLIIGKPIKNAELDFENQKGNAGYQIVANKAFAAVCDLYDTDVQNAKK